ncbi:uncharacterized protein TNCT_136611 [Trichonephila clavata]|uniref:Uncharacterized protein n=1 Tax=Trichonephila clavata TaxID=2740835 RepID=A0A8X6GIF5_TRICU|nr:uncharacterized protein TNCT_136611 [Trichonephila clavata]
MRTSPERGSDIGESEHDVESPKLFELNTDEHYLAEKLAVEEHLGKAPRDVEECHQRNTGPLKSHVLQLEWDGYDRLWTSPLAVVHHTAFVSSVTHNSVVGFVPCTSAPLHAYTVFCMPPK